MDFFQILRQLTGKTVTWEQAQCSLEEKFSKNIKKTNKTPIILLVDEVRRFLFKIFCNY